MTKVSLRLPADEGLIIFRVLVTLVCCARMQRNALVVSDRVNAIHSVVMSARNKGKVGQKTSMIWTEP